MVVVGEFQGFGMGCGGHFGPRFVQGVDDFVVGGFAGEVGELILQEHEAKGVFKHAAFGIGREFLFKVEVLHAKNDIFGVTGLAENVSGFLGMKGLESGAPLEITGAGHGTRGAGDLPATEMLAAGGELELLGGAGAKLEHPLAQFLREEQFARLGNAVHLLDIRVGCVILVEAGDGRRETIGVADAGTHLAIVGEGGEAATKSFERNVKSLKRYIVTMVTRDGLAEF